MIFMTFWLRIICCQSDDADVVNRKLRGGKKIQMVARIENVETLLFSSFRVESENQKVPVCWKREFTEFPKIRKISPQKDDAIVYQATGACLSEEGGISEGCVSYVGLVRAEFFWEFDVFQREIMQSAIIKIIKQE